METIRNYGFCTKTVLINVYEGASTLALQINNELGLPDNFLIFGFLVRPHSNDTTAHNNQTLVSKTIFENAFLNLYTINEHSKKIQLTLDTVPLSTIEGQGMQTIPPTLSENIDWARSHIALNKTAFSASFVENTVFELVVLYTLGDSEHIHLDNKVQFREACTYQATNRLYKDISLNDIQTKYHFRRNNISIPPDALVIGFSVKQAPTLLKGKTINKTSVQTGYLSLHKGNTIFIESFPLFFTDYKKLLPFNLNYFPIVPIEANTINWSSCCIDLLNINDVEDGEVFQIILHWIDKPTLLVDCKTSPV